MLTVRFLGPPDITQDGDVPPAELRWRKNTALLAYLVCAPSPRSRDHLASLLWGDRPERAAKQSLREALRVLRHAVGHDGLATDGNTVCLATDAIRSDLKAFERCCTESAWPAAAALVRGDFLEGLVVPDASAYEDWLAALRLSYRTRFVSALVAAAEEALGGSNAASAIEWGTQALQLNTASERAARATIQALGMQHDRVAALAVYQALEQALREYGTEPDAQTRRLAARIRAGRAWRHHVPASRENGLRRTALVGRDAHLRTMLDTWHTTVSQGRHSVILMESDPGCGMTRLVGEFLDRARLEGAVICAVRGVPIDRDEPWSGIAGLVGDGLPDAPGVSATPLSAVATLCTLSAPWRDRFPAADRDLPLPSPGRAWQDVLTTVVDEGPVVIAVDDAHWLDDESMGALEATIQRITTAPVVTCLASNRRQRPAAYDRLRARIGHQLPGVAISLHPLTYPDVRTLCARAMPDYGSDELDRLAKRVVADSSGLPLLVVDLVDAVERGMTLEASAHPWPAPNQTLDDTFPADLPPTVVGSIRVAFRDLPPKTQEVLRATACLGDRASADAVRRAAGLAEDVVDAALDELEWTRWLVADARGYTFTARIAREVVLADLVSAGQRRRIEERAARP